jgi:hypothetical protein
MNIETIIGMDPSVQVSASKLLVYPGEEVVLNGRGASIFVWDALDGTVQNFTGPQLVAHPAATTTFMTVGSGLKLCNDTTYTTIYVRENVTGLEPHPDPLVAGISVYPNPGTAQLNVIVENTERGLVTIQMFSIIGSEATNPVIVEKTEDRLIKTFDMSTFRQGVYVVSVKLGERSVVKKWVKY